MIRREEQTDDEDQRANHEGRERHGLQRLRNLAARRGEHFGRGESSLRVQAHGRRSALRVESVGVFRAESAAVFLVESDAAAPGGIAGGDVGPDERYGTGRVGPMSDAPGTYAPVSPGRPCDVSAAMPIFPCNER